MKLTKLFSALFILAIVGSACNVNTTGTVSIGCGGFGVSGWGLSIGASDTFTAVAHDSAGATIFNGSLGTLKPGNYTGISKSFGWTKSPAQGKITLVISSTQGSPSTFTGTCNSNLNFTDGRCNQEPWQSFAVYPDGQGGYIFYALYQGTGYFALHVTKQQLKDNPDKGTNYIMAQNKGIQLYRLQGGLLQVHRIGMDGKDYSFNLNACG